MKKLMIRDLALLCLSAACFSPGLVLAAGNLIPPAPPGAPGSALYTLQDIWNRLSFGDIGSKRTEGFVEPISDPANEGVTLNDIMAVAPQQDAAGANPVEVVEGKMYWSLRTDSSWGLQAGTLSLPPADVPMSGQTDTIAVGDDGELQTGAAWPDPRFTDNTDGTVTDNLTGLIWLKDATCFSALSWSEAVAAAITLNSGECQLGDESVAGDWRLPTAQELSSLVDFGRANPAIDAANFVFPVGDPGKIYWSSTTYTPSSDQAWVVDFASGTLESRIKSSEPSLVWPVHEPQVQAPQ